MIGVYSDRRAPFACLLYTKNSLKNKEKHLTI